MLSLSDPYRLRLFFELGALTLGVSAWVWVRFSRLAGVTAAWIGFSAIRVFAAPVFPIDGAKDYWITRFDSAARDSLALTLLSCSAALLPIHWLVRFFQGYAVINGAAIFGGLFWNGAVGLTFNASMSGCFQVALIPVLYLKRINPWLIAFVVASVFASKQSQPILLLALLAIITAIRNRDYKNLAIATGAVVPALWLFAGKMGAFSSRGRVLAWQAVYPWWETHVNPWIGMGGGSFEIAGPEITRPVVHEKFHVLHSDWMQIVFEQGLVGLLLALALYGLALWRMRKTECTFLALVGSRGMCKPGGIRPATRPSERRTARYRGRDRST